MATSRSASRTRHRRYSRPLIRPAAASSSSAEEAPLISCRSPDTVTAPLAAPAGSSPVGYSMNAARGVTLVGAYAGNLTKPGQPLVVRSLMDVGPAGRPRGLRLV